MARLLTALLAVVLALAALACDGGSDESPATGSTSLTPSASAPPTVSVSPTVTSPAPTASASPTASSSPAASSGIEGRVLAGPQCPVVREGSPCPDRPIPATVDVMTPDRSRLVTSFTSGEDGSFRVPLAPGDYLIVPRPAPSFALSPGAPQPVTVLAGEWTAVTIDYDTGIR